MPSEHRLHPATLLFSFASSVKAFALPGLLAALSVGRGGFGGSWGPWRGFEGSETWQLWLMILIVPSVLAAAARYWSFRLRYEATELVIRTGILFRNERHIPYARIQNLDAVQNVVHRLLGVLEVRIDTGAGKEPEATISVLPESALADMRHRVFADRLPAADAVAVANGAIEGGRTLLRLPVRELLLFGALENRGLVLVAAAYGLAWETGLLGSVWGRVFDNGEARATVRGLLRGLMQGDVLNLVPLALAAAGILGILVVIRLISMVWAVVRLYGFHLVKIGEDLRTEFGLITRVSTTIPLRRVQAVTIRDSPLYRLASRASVRVETAGGGQGGQQQQTRRREALAPLIPRTQVASVLTEVLPGFDAAGLDWQAPDPRAFRRAVRAAIVVAASATLMAAFVEWRLVTLLPVAVGAAVFVVRQYVRHLQWAETADVVAFRTGWLWRSLTVARVSKIQAVTRVESPFDRRWGMARVRIDTAGAHERSHRIDIPYLPRDLATALQARLAAGAAYTPFRW